MHLLDLVLYCYVFVIVVLSLICPDPVKLNQGRFSLHVAVVMRFSHLKPDGELPEVITPQILSALLSNERFWVSQQFKDIVQGLTCHAGNLIVRLSAKLLPIRIPKPHLLYFVKSSMVPDWYTDKVLPVVVMGVMIAVVYLITLTLHLPIIRKEGHAHQLLYRESLLRPILPPLPLVRQRIQRDDFIIT